VVVILVLSAVVVEKRLGHYLFFVAEQDHAMREMKLKPDGQPVHLINTFKHATANTLP
jgi:hypothetical protein